MWESQARDRFAQMGIIITLSHAAIYGHKVMSELHSDIFIAKSGASAMKHLSFNN